MWVTGTQVSRIQGKSRAAILTPLTDAITAAALLSASVQHVPIPAALAQGAVNPGRSTIAFLTSSTDDLVAAVPSGPIQGVGHDEDPGSVIDAVGQTNVEPGDMVDEDPDEDMVDEDPYMQNVPLVIPNAAADGPRKRGARPGVEIPLLHFLWSPQGTEGGGRWRPSSELGDAFRTEMTGLLAEGMLANVATRRSWATVTRDPNPKLGPTRCVGHILFGKEFSRAVCKWEKAAGDEKAACDTCIRKQ
jgi:hypothetical protein